MDKKLVSLLSLFLLTFGVFAGAVMFNKPLTQFTRATDANTPSTTNSVVLAFPLTASADGKQTTVVSVFIRSVTDKPIPNQQVTLTTSVGTVSIPSQTTDAEGKATFTVSSSQPGTAEIEAAINGQKLSQKVNVKFE